MEWVDFYAIEPWGSMFDDALNGQTCAVMANLQRDPEKRPEPFGRTDFTLTVEAEPERELCDAEIEVELAKILGG